RPALGRASRRQCRHAGDGKPAACEARRAGRRTEPHRDLARRRGRHHGGRASGHAGHAMELGEAMMVAGIGCRTGVGAGDVMAAVEAALARHNLSPAALSALATAHFKHAEQAITATGKALNLPLLLVDDAALRAVSLRALTRSDASL